MILVIGGLVFLSGWSFGEFLRLRSVARRFR